MRARARVWRGGTRSGHTATPYLHVADADALLTLAARSNFSVRLLVEWVVVGLPPPASANDHDHAATADARQQAGRAGTARERLQLTQEVCALRRRASEAPHWVDWAQLERGQQARLPSQTRSAHK